MGSKLPEFQELGSGTWKKIPGCDRNSGAGLFGFEFEECCPCFEKETMTEQALPPALLLGTRRPEFSPTLSAHSGDAPSTVNYAYRSGTWIFAHGDGFCHLSTEEDIIPVDHCDLGGVSSESS
uniref:Uncharacterized protein n=1 Tax=Moschus moschiferus TaxID=68415 RepID=A0A8C6G361_MOSMO